jgi:hypothetical protein
MIALNKTIDQVCRQLLAAFFKKFPNARLQAETNRALKKLLAHQIPMPGKPSGWVAGIIYAVANQNRWPCGVPGLLNKEYETFFKVTMGTIYKRAWQIRGLLAI